jgi:hypothetical protein
MAEVIEVGIFIGLDHAGGKFVRLFSSIHITFPAVDLPGCRIKQDIFAFYNTLPGLVALSGEFCSNEFHNYHFFYIVKINTFKHIYKNIFATMLQIKTPYVETKGGVTK